MAAYEAPLLIFLALVVLGLLRYVLDRVFSDAMYRAEPGGRPTIHVQPLFCKGRHAWMKPAGIAVTLAVGAVGLLQHLDGYPRFTAAALLGLVSGNMLSSLVLDLDMLWRKLTHSQKKGGMADSPVTAWVCMAFLCLELAWSVARVTGLIPVWNVFA